jgi:hypothetical protein
LCFQTRLGDCLFEQLLQFSGSVRGATAPGTPRLAPVGTDKNMPFKIGQSEFPSVPASLIFPTALALVHSLPVSALCSHRFFPGHHLQQVSSATIEIANMSPDNLLSLKDDMVAFIEGHGMHRLPGFVTEDIPTVLWEDGSNPEGWKDFVEMAKRASAPFVTMSEIVLEKPDLEILLQQIREDNFPDEEVAELQEAQFLVNYVGKMGFIQLGFAYQGVVFIHESATEWYERYQQLLEFVDDFSNLVFGDEEDDDRG